MARLPLSAPACAENKGDAEEYRQCADPGHLAGPVRVVFAASQGAVGEAEDLPIWTCPGTGRMVSEIGQLSTPQR